MFDFFYRRRTHPPASPALGHELGPNGAARDCGRGTAETEPNKMSVGVCVGLWLIKKNPVNPVYFLT
jgi:hypothetical protein